MSTLTKRAIKDAFIQLLDERPLNKITVKAIVDTCGINRNSFYYHFADIPSMVEELIMEETDRLIAEHASTDSLEECLDVALEFTMKKKQAMLHLYHSVNRDIYERYLMKLCEYTITEYLAAAYPNLSISQEDRTILIRFYKCEFFGQIIEWLNDNMRYDIRKQYMRICELRGGVIEEWLKNSSSQP